MSESPTQASGACCGILPSGTPWWSSFVTKLRPRHLRKLVYQSRLHEGSADLTEARRLYASFSTTLHPEVSRNLDGELRKLEKERETFLPFSEYHYSHRAQADAVERAATFRDRSKIILVRVKAKHDAWEMGVASQQRGGSRRSSRSRTQQPRGSPNTYGSASSQQTYAQVAVYEEQPLQTVQARASPVTVAPSPPSNALNLELGPRQSPRFPVMTPPQRRLHDSPMYQGSPASPGRQRCRFVSTSFAHISSIRSEFVRDGSVPEVVPSGASPQKSTFICQLSVRLQPMGFQSGCKLGHDV
ncbi:hypothetical protein FKP32DRAFT_271995 [Trametes sanguinea]|nr:hypothetical protein FKP32DRAFT_271995 [Trametes sanguinea]